MLKRICLYKVLNYGYSSLMPRFNVEWFIVNNNVFVIPDEFLVNTLIFFLDGCINFLPCG